MLNDPLANALNNITTAQQVGKQFCVASPVSKLMLELLNLFKDHHLIGDIEVVKNGRGDIVKINLIGKINRCGAIKPRFAVTKTEYEKFEKRYLPARDFGFLVVSTSKGMMTNVAAKEKGLGGKLLAYVY